MLWRRVSGWWRSNLQFRVILSTMVLCLIVMGFLLTFIYQQIAEGLVEGKTASSRQEAANGTQTIQNSLEQADRTDPESMNDLIGTLLHRAQQQRTDSSQELVFTRSLASTRGPSRLKTISTAFDIGVIPTELRQAIHDNPTHQQLQTVTIPYRGNYVPSLIIGSQVSVPGDEAHELYYIFPMEREAATLDMVERTFVLGSTVFMVLIGLVSYVVTRFVVDPVREAAVVAGRLSSGHLNERMHVRGEDDLAKLATSFNDMADHLQSHIDQLEDLSRVQQRFVSDVSHELRTPLTTIRMAAELLYAERSEFAPATGRSVELLHAEVDRFESLLADLLEISRFDAGAAVLDRENADLVDIARRALVGVEGLADHRDVPITLVGGDTRLPVPCDPRRVERILRNLLVNAIEHSEGQPIEVELAGNETAVAVAVRDHGVGLRPGEADLVFNRFWRADPARRRTIGGTGLGLAIAMEDARLHDGWLHAWGEPGLGSRFRLTLPRVQDRPIGLPPLPLTDPVPPPAPEPADPDPADAVSVGPVSADSVSAAPVSVDPVSVDLESVDAVSAGQVSVDLESVDAVLADPQSAAPKPEGSEPSDRSESPVPAPSPPNPGDQPGPTDAPARAGQPGLADQPIVAGTSGVAGEPGVADAPAQADEFEVLGGSGPTIGSEPSAPARSSTGDRVGTAGDAVAVPSGDGPGERDR